MATPNDVLAWLVLGGLGAAVGVAIWRATRSRAEVEVGMVERYDARIEAQVTLRNRAKTTVALESVEVTKVGRGRGGDDGGVTATAEDDIRMPVEAGGEIEGRVTFGWSGEAPGEGERMRVLFVFRSPTGPELAEAWVRA